MKSAQPSWLIKDKRSGHDSAANDSPIDYHGWKWRKFSERYKRANPMCAECKRQGKLNFGNVTDHVIPVRCGGAIDDERNLQNLCKTHDDDKRNKESRGDIPAYVGEYGYRIPVDVAPA